jgi:hypothetical protein
MYEKNWIERDLPTSSFGNCRLKIMAVVSSQQHCFNLESISSPVLKRATDKTAALLGIVLFRNTQVSERRGALSSNSLVCALHNEKTLRLGCLMPV